MKQRICISTILLMACLSGSAYAADYYAAPNGGESAGTKRDPWSLAYGNRRLEPGDRLFLMGGRYATPIAPKRSGEKGRRIVYQAAPSAKPIIDFGVRLKGDWRKVSGRDGTDAVYRRQTSNFRMIWQDSFDEVGRYVSYWKRDLHRTKGASKCECVERPGEFYRSGGYTYLMTADADNPSKHLMVGVDDKNRAFELTDRSYITIDDIDVRYVDRVVESRNSSYITVANSNIAYVTGYGVFSVDHAHHWVIRNNVIHEVGSIIGHSANALSLWEGSHHNLVEGNEIYHSGHAGIKNRNTNFNVIRNNYVHDNFGKLLEHDSGKSNVYEYNRLEGSPRAEALTYQHPSDHPVGQQAGTNTIYRFNEHWHNAGGVYFRSNSDKNREFDGGYYYHNVFYRNEGDRRRGAAWGVIRDYGRDNHLMNNIFADNGTTRSRNKASQVSFYDYSQRGMDEQRWYLTSNLFYSEYGEGVIQDGDTLTQAEGKFGKYIHNNVWGEPRFVAYNTERPDFRLKGDSAGIDAGQCLTKAAGSGKSSKVVRVDDARPFFDGYGIVEGDKIKVGGNPIVQIRDIDYRTGRIDVAREINWSDNDCVHLNYAGAAPDIGAYEHRGGDQRPRAPTGLTLGVK